MKTLESKQSSDPPMTKRRMNQLRYYAYKVRRAVENMANGERDSNSVSVSDTRKHVLGGLCARASAMLSYEFDRVGIPHQLVYGSAHIYIECEGYVVDITATQFNFKDGRTLIRPLSKMRARSGGWWRSSIKFNTVSDVISWQKDDYWPEEQSIQDSDLEYLWKTKDNGRG